MILFFEMPLFWIGAALFSYFIWTAPEDCPERYQKTIEKGGVLENAGDIHRYCNMISIDGRYYFMLKKEYESDSSNNNKQ